MKTNQIIINIKKGADGYPLFEEIQNKFCLYDNCVLDTDDDGTQQIRIEGKNLKQIEKLAEKLKTYVKKLKIVQVSMEDTIVDDDRREETGGFEV